MHYDMLRDIYEERFGPWNNVGAKVNKKVEVKLPYWLGSMDKYKPEHEKEINDWIINAGSIASHKWSSGEIVIWDNRRVQHRGTGFNEAKYRRIMHRTTVAGDKPSFEEVVSI